MTVTIHFLTSESNIRSLLNFGCFSTEITNCLIMSKHFLAFSLERYLIMVLFKNSPSREKG